MRIHPKVLVIQGVHLVLTIALIALFVLKDWSTLLLIPIIVTTLLISILLSTYINRTEVPYCKCGKKLSVAQKTLLSQTEIVRHGRFVFYYKYEIEYHCTACNQQLKLNKVVTK